MENLSKIDTDSSTLTVFIDSEYDDVYFEMSNVALFVFAGYITYLLLIIIGIPANLFVLIKMVRLRRSNPDLYHSGTGICLLTMALADIASLISILSFCMLSFNFAKPSFLTSIGYVLMCKITIFTMHTATSVAIWSWLIMSILRWLALYRPFVHRTLYDLPMRVIAFVVTVSSLTNSWLFFTVSYDSVSHTGCTQRWLFGSEPLTRVLLLIEIGWSFVIPIFIVAYLDLSTMVTIPKLLKSRFDETALKQLNHEDGHHKKNNHTLVRWLVIALIDILLNAPENLRRLVTILGILPSHITDSDNYVVFKTVSDVFYYSQYSFNALYLALFIYDKCTAAATPRQSNPSVGVEPVSRTASHRDRKSRCGTPNISMTIVNREFSTATTARSQQSSQIGTPTNQEHLLPLQCNQYQTGLGV